MKDSKRGSLSKASMVSREREGSGRGEGDFQWEWCCRRDWLV